MICSVYLVPKNSTMWRCQRHLASLRTFLRMHLTPQYCTREIYSQNCVVWLRLPNSLRNLLLKPRAIVLSSRLRRHPGSPNQHLYRNLDLDPQQTSQAQRSLRNQYSSAFTLVHCLWEQQTSPLLVNTIQINFIKVLVNPEQIQQRRSCAGSPASDKGRWRKQ